MTLQFSINLTVPRRIVATARQYLQTRPYDWAYGRSLRVEQWGIGFPNIVPAAAELCNLFVGSVLQGASANPPIRRGMSQKPYPIPADAWWSGNGTDPHWIGGLDFDIFPRNILHPIPGDVMSNGEHVGIVSECQPDGYGGLMGKTISAPIYSTTDWRQNGLVENDWGFRPGTLSAMRISRHYSVESNYALRMQTGRPQPQQYPRIY
jgi:hypothetical protein